MVLPQVVDIAAVLAALVAVGAAVALFRRARDAEQHLSEAVRLSQELAYVQADAQAAAARYEQLFDSCPLPLWVYDRDSLAFLAVNSAAIRHYGWTREEFLAMKVTEIRPESERAAFLAYIEARRRLDPAPPRNEWINHTKDGRRIIVETSSTEIRLDGRPARLVVANDITERRRAEEAQARSEQAYRSLVEGAPVGIYRSTRAGRFTMVNPALVAMLGYGSEDELLQLDVKDLYADPSERERLIAAISTTEPTFLSEVEWRRKDGRPVSLLLTGRPVRGAGGEAETFEVIVEDRTERRALEQQLRQAQKMEAVGQLAGGIAHDFNNLLTTILGTLDLLEGPEAPAEGRAADLRDIRRAAQRGAELTHKLLAFGRRRRLETRALDLAEAAAEFMTMARRVVPENIHIDFAIDQDCTVVADAGAVQQILLNLLTNARDALPDGGTIRLAVGCEMLGDDRSAALGCRAGQYAVIHVADNGSGMDEETRRRLFEPFFTTKPVEKGSGLGMAMVYGLVKQHRGAIRVESERGLGTNVWVYLPRAPSRGGGPAAPRAVARREREGRPATILLVEDEAPLRRVAQRVLERFGFTVVAAADGVEALELFRQRPRSFDLVLTDIVMPRLGGVALLEALRTLRPDIRLLCMSGYPARDTALHGPAWEQVPFLPKPWTMEALIAKVDEVLALPPSVIQR